VRQYWTFSFNQHDFSRQKSYKRWLMFMMNSAKKLVAVENQVFFVFFRKKPSAKINSFFFLRKKLTHRDFELKEIFLPPCSIVYLPLLSWSALLSTGVFRPFSCLLFFFRHLPSFACFSFSFFLFLFCALLDHDSCLQ